MNILFLTLFDFESITEPGIYTDLLREFARDGHRLFIISPTERRRRQKTHLVEEDNTKILKLRIGNIQKTNVIEKGISTVTLESIFIHGIRRFFGDIPFDLVIYSTPPITFCKAVEYVKQRDKAGTYLLLKDIFPQNAVDIGMMATTGPKGLLYRFFRNKEKKLYALSDYIGCMSQANVEYVIRHNPEVDPSIVEVCPNSIEVVDKSVDAETRSWIRKKYGIPQDRKVFVYGGNLGKPQGIGFLIECLKAQRGSSSAYFLIVGDGTEYARLETFMREQRQENVKLMRRLPKEDYDTLVAACDVGMIFLDHRFTIPNFPSRLLSYMQAKLPVLACTDPNTDIGKVITGGGFGWWCESDNLDRFGELVVQVLEDDLAARGEKAYQYLCEKYSSRECYEKIMGME